MLSSDRLEQMRTSAGRSIGQWAHWAWQGVVEVGHNSLAVIGLACIGVVLLFSSDTSLRLQVERQALEWLNVRHGAPAPAEEATDLLAELSEPDAIARATAADPSALPREQARVVSWLSRRYRVAPEPVASLVQEAWSIGKKAKIEPTLILAIIAIESSFNPFAQSPVGAQGLMQVMTRVHDDKYTAFGGRFAAFDPAANLRVGAQILTDYLGRAGGDLALALKYYVGAANLPDDGGYADRVLTEQGYLRAVASGQNVSWSVSNTRPAPAVSAQLGEAVKVAANSATPKSSAASAGSTSKSASMPAAAQGNGVVMAPAVGAPISANLSDGKTGTGAAAESKTAPPAAKAAEPAARAGTPAPAAATPARRNAEKAAPASAPAEAAAAAAGRTQPGTAPGDGRVALADGVLR